MIVDKISESIIYTYQVSHVIYTIIHSVSPDILINFFQCLIQLTVHTGARTPAEPIWTWHTVPLSERESDQITSISFVIIIYTVLIMLIGNPMVKEL